MRLILVRHGETESNNLDLLQGQKDGNLSERGQRQAVALAEALRTEKIDAIYSSDLHRGRETAETIARQHRLTVREDPAARERSFGVFEGTNRTDFYARERGLPDPVSHIPIGGESFLQLYDRASVFLQRLIRTHPKQTVVVVCHGDFARMSIGVLTGRDAREACRIRQTNGCINVIEVKEGLRSEVIVLDRTDHLPPEIMSHNRSAL